jgi:hypothetical protein
MKTGNTKCININMAAAMSQLPGKLSQSNQDRPEIITLLPGIASGNRQIAFSHDLYLGSHRRVAAGKKLAFDNSKEFIS